MPEGFPLLYLSARHFRAAKQLCTPRKHALRARGNSTFSMPRTGSADGFPSRGICKEWRLPLFGASVPQANLLACAEKMPCQAGMFQSVVQPLSFRQSRKRHATASWKERGESPRECPTYGTRPRRIGAQAGDKICCRCGCCLGSERMHSQKMKTTLSC